MQEIIKRLKSVQNRLLLDLPERLRPFFKTIRTTNRAIIITGARGTGKTTFMLTQLQDKKYFYLSADHPIAATVPLYDLVEAIFLEGYEGVFIDEIHYAVDWSKHLKALYDSFPHKIIWGSDSSSVVMRGGIADLSRRFVYTHIPLLSLREYIYLETGDELQVINPYNEDRKNVYKILKKINILKWFRDYMEHGFRPLYTGNIADYQEKVMNTIVKSMTSDIPFLVPQLSQNHFRFMNAVVGHLAVSNIPTLSINSLCKKWGIGKEKLYQLLNAMEQTNVIRLIRKKNDISLYSIGAKIFLYEPSVYGFFDGNIGNIRESYAAGISMESKRKVFASDNEPEYDFLIDKLKIEVGGKKKKSKKADFVLRDGVDIPDGIVIPLWMLGFEY
ncbi:MAG: ATP-binding protein [Candidatus Aminicenantes bacterium]|nr:ATP-binding protein [Candidatus Aminicenantes bacterium]